MSEFVWAIYRTCYGLEKLVEIIINEPVGPLYLNENAVKSELRPLHQPPCEWEEGVAKGADRYRIKVWKYCPMCGRKLS